MNLDRIDNFNNIYLDDEEIYSYMKRMTTGYEKSNLAETAFVTNLIISFLAATIIIGTIGNLFNILIFSKIYMRRVSIFRYLLYLSIVDLLVLLICAPDAVLRYYYEIEIRQYSNIICRIYSFLSIS